MSDPDAMPDPIDKAYLEAEAVLSDEAARAARRARVLAAIARQGAPVAAPPAVRRPAWRRGGWLVAACVSGLALIVAVEVYRPSAYPPPPIKPTAAPVAPATATKEVAAAPTASAPAPAAALAKAPPRTERSEAEPPPVDLAPPPAPPPAAPSAGDLKPWPSPSEEPAPPLPPSLSAQADAASERAASVPPVNHPRKSGADDRAGVTQMVVTAEKRESPRQSAPAAVSAFTGRFRDVSDPGARLRSAAADGRTTEMESLLEHGAPVDSPDADGNTALMKSIEAGRPAAAALLRRYGASLDRTNHAGESAKDMARAKADAELNQAIGLSP